MKAMLTSFFVHYLNHNILAGQSIQTFHRDFSSGRLKTYGAVLFNLTPNKISLEFNGRLYV